MQIFYRIQEKCSNKEQVLTGNVHLVSIVCSFYLINYLCSGELLPLTGYFLPRNGKLTFFYKHKETNEKKKEKKKLSPETNLNAKKVTTTS